MSKLFFAFLLCGATLAAGCEKKGSNDNGENGHEPGGQITLDHVDGLYAIDSVKTDTLITFYIRLTNNKGSTIEGLTHGFRIYSPDGATWDTTIGINTGSIDPTMFDQDIFILSFSVSGSNVDTIGFGGFNMFGTGILDGFDDVAFAVQVGPINTSYHGNRICIDSSWYPPGGDWLWSTTGGSVHPDWDGAQCFRIVNPAALSARKGGVDSEM